MPDPTVNTNVKNRQSDQETKLYDSQGKDDCYSVNTKHRLIGSTPTQDENL